MTKPRTKPKPPHIQTIWGEPIIMSELEPASQDGEPVCWLDDEEAMAAFVAWMSGERDHDEATHEA